jgi:alpha-L-rhamnosidase
MKRSFCHWVFCIVFFLGIQVQHVLGGSHLPIAPTGITIYETRCESLLHPIGIMAPQPSFSWKLATTVRGVKQTAYRVRVASSLNALNTNPDLWDSGQINADQNTFVVYDGKPLHSAHTYYWSVQVWNNKTGKPTWSEVDSFATGILKEEEWDEVSWIGYEAMEDSMVVYPGIHHGSNHSSKTTKRSIVPYLRKSFKVNKTVQRALVFVSGLGQYELRLNGQKVGNDFLAPGWTNYNKTCLYNTYDVTAQLQQKENVIGAIVGNGFFNINNERYSKLVIAQGYPMLCLQLVIQYTDGTTKKIITDNSWKAAPSPVVFSSIYGGEDYDARLEQEGWCKAGFDDTRWQQALAVKGPSGEMSAQMSYPLQVMDSFDVKKVYTPQPGKYVVDFGQNASGIVRIKVKGEKGTVVKITPAELLDDKQLPYQGASGAPYSLSYTLKGNGTEVWEPRFTYYGFRYAMIEGALPPGVAADNSVPQLTAIQSLHTRNSAPATGSFECSDTLFNKIYSLINWAIRSNLSSVSTDCPHREKLGWLEQTHLLGAACGYNYDILHLYNKTVSDMMAAQLPNGLVPDIAPEYVVFDEGFRDSPEWGSAAILVPWYLYQWYGDKQVLAKAYNMMQRYLDYLGTKANGNILDYGLGDWFDMGPAEPGQSQLTPIALTATAVYFQDADCMQQIAAILGKQDDAAKYAQLATGIRKAFNDKFFNAQTKVYATGSQTAYAMPLYTGLVHEADRKAVFENLLQSIQQSNKALTAGDIGYHYLVSVLGKGGASQLLYEMNNRDDVPGYAYQLKHGATALTESWPALRFVSNNHMMLGHLMEWLYSGLAGIRTVEGEAGFSSVLIQPQPVGDMKWVKSTFETMQGQVKVQWQKKGNTFTLDVQVPPNTTANVVLPPCKNNSIKESGNSLQKAAGVVKVATIDGQQTITIGSGAYHFVASLH